MEYTVRFCFDKEGQAYDDLLNTMDAIVKAKGGTILKSFDKEFRAISVCLDDVLPEMDRWRKANPDVSCWLQYYKENDDLSLPYGEIAGIGVREYTNGELAYSMDGCIGHIENTKPEKTSIEGKCLTIQKVMTKVAFL